MSQEGGHYYVPAPSPWPITGSIALLFMGFGAAFSVNKLPLGYGLLAIGFAILIYMMFGWFGVVAKESEAGTYQPAGGQVFPLGDELVHFFRGHVLCSLLWCPVLHARVFNSLVVGSGA